MSINPLLSRPAPSAGAAPIASPGGSSLGNKPFGAKSLQRKRPVGLSIDKAIESSRAPPGVPLNGDGRASLSEAEQLRQDIAKLQLSSRSSDSESPATSPTQPLTPNTLNQSDSSSSGKKKKDGKKKHKVDKDGLDLVKDEDLEILTDLGAGNGGTVTKVWNKKRKCIMARKVGSCGRYHVMCCAIPLSAGSTTLTCSSSWSMPNHRYENKLCASCKS